MALIVIDSSASLFGPEEHPRSATTIFVQYVYGEKFGGNHYLLAQYVYGEDLFWHC
jgi:hypothetical protein